MSKIYENRTSDEERDRIRQDTQFKRELVSVINKCSRENHSNTPDFILAEYLMGCLEAFEFTVNARAEWYKKEKTPGVSRRSSDKKVSDFYNR